MPNTHAPDIPPLKLGRRGWLAYIALWLLPVVSTMTQRQLIIRTWDDVKFDLIDELIYQSGIYFLYALMAIGVYWASRRFPVDPQRWWRAIPAHFAIATLFMVTRIAILGLFAKAAGGFDGVGKDYAVLVEILLIRGFHTEYLAYLLMLGISTGIDHLRRARAMALRTSELKAQLVNAELSALRMQLHPHFLFNTLNAIAALVRAGEDKRAVTMIARLSDLLRVALEGPGEQVVPLAQELKTLDLYLSIEEVRFPDRLSVHREIDPALHTVMVPNLILQPLVENAIGHGIAPLAQGGRVRIRAKREGDMLILEIEDNGAGLPEGFSLESQCSVGLGNTRARLIQLYGDAQSLSLTPIPTGGTLARITLPITINPEVSHGA